MKSKLTHSYSSIKMYENCPKRYLYQRINKEVVDTGSDATIYGQRIHKDLENRLLHGQALPQETSKHEQVCQTLQNLPNMQHFLQNNSYALMKTLHQQVGTIRTHGSGLF